MSNEAKTVHIRIWNEYKELAATLKPSSIAYALQRAPLSKPPVGLRLIFAAQNVQYVFLDFAEGDALKQTRIPIETNSSGEATINDESIRDFLQSQFKRRDLRVYSLEVLGY